MYARRERTHRGQDVFSHLVVCNFVLGLPRAAHRIGGETSGQQEPGPLLSALCWAVVETAAVRYNRPAQQQRVGRYSNIDTRLDTSWIDSRINGVPIH